METYKVIRIYQSGRRKTIKRNLPLSLAQEHCRNPETSSRTCKRKTRSVWFDGYEKE